MVDLPRQEIKLFYSYAQEDKHYRDELEKHLALLKRRYQLTTWYDREILPGEEWEQAIDTHLDNADLILLLISSDFMASDYCYGKEMKRALERHQAGTCRVVPILLRPTEWEDAPFSSLEPLPSNKKPVILWRHQDEAFANVAKGINRTILGLLNPLKTREDWLQEGNALYNLERYEEALDAYKQAIRLDPNFADAYNNKGWALYSLKRYEEALAAYEQAIRLDPDLGDAYNGKGAALYDLKRSRGALAAYEQAIRLDPNLAGAYNGKGNILYDLERYEEALAIFEQAIRLDPNLAVSYNNKGWALCNLKRCEEALAAFEQAIHLDPRLTDAYNGQGWALYNLKRYKEALAASEQALRLDPNNTEALDGKDRALVELKRHEEAR